MSVSDKIQDIVVDLLLPPQDVGVNWFVTSFVGALSVWVSQRDLLFPTFLKESNNGHSVRYTNT